MQYLDAEAMRAEVTSPTYTGGLYRSGRAALVDPAVLVHRHRKALAVQIEDDAPLRAAEDAVEIDTSHMGIEQAVAAATAAPSASSGVSSITWLSRSTEISGSIGKVTPSQMP